MNTIPLSMMTAIVEIMNNVLLIFRRNGMLTIIISKSIAPDNSALDMVVLTVPKSPRRDNISPALRESKKLIGNFNICDKYEKFNCISTL